MLGQTENAVKWTTNKYTNYNVWGIFNPLPVLASKFMLHCCPGLPATLWLKRSYNSSLTSLFKHITISVHYVTVSYVTYVTEILHCLYDIKNLTCHYISLFSNRLDPAKFFKIFIPAHCISFFLYQSISLSPYQIQSLFM